MNMRISRLKIVVSSKYLVYQSKCQYPHQKKHRKWNDIRQASHHQLHEHPKLFVELHEEMKFGYHLNCDAQIAKDLS